MIKGNNAVLATLNRYDYCWNKPIDLVDKNGREPDYTAIGESIGNAITSLGETIGNAAGEVGEAIGNATEDI